MQSATRYNPFVTNSLEAYVFSPKNLSELDERLWQAYNLWFSIWGQALSEEMNIQSQLRSDNFTRAESVVALFKNNLCVALFTTNLFDLSNPIHRNDSYFIDWSNPTLDKLKRSRLPVMTLENFTIGRSIRGTYDMLPWKELLVLLALSKLLDERLPFLLSTPRKLRSMHKVAANTGASALEVDVEYKIPGEVVDLVVWDPTSPDKVWEKECWALAQKIWKTKN